MSSLFTHPPVLGLAAFSGSGKTTLLTALLPVLQTSGLRVGVIKHSHHDFEIDLPGKDSFLLRKAGALQMLIASPFRTAFIVEHKPQSEPRLEALLDRLDRKDLDLILVEGFRHVDFPKMEIHRAATEKPFLYPRDPSIIALVSDERAATDLPWMDIDDLPQIALFIRAYIASTESGTTA